MDYNREERTLTVRWKNGYHGELTLRYSGTVNGVLLHEMKDDFESEQGQIILLLYPSRLDSGTLVARFRVDIRAKFSPVRLYLQKDHVGELIAWTIRRLFEIRNLDWDWHRNLDAVRDTPPLGEPIFQLGETEDETDV